MTAVSVAKTLLETDPDVHVAVIEARRLCSGATGRNGGHLKSDAVMSFSSLRERFGEVEALRIVKYQKMNVDRVRQVAKEYCPRESELRDVEAVVGCQDQTTLDRLRASVDAYKATQPSGSVRYQFTDGDTAMKVGHRGRGRNMVTDGYLGIWNAWCGRRVNDACRGNVAV